MSEYGVPGSRAEHVVVGAIWQHRQKSGLRVTIRRITDQGKVLGPSTSASGHTLSVATLIRSYEFVEMESR